MKVGDHVRISKYENIFGKVYILNYPDKKFVVKKVKLTVPWTYVIEDLKGEEIVGAFHKKELQKKRKKMKKSLELKK